MVQNIRHYICVVACVYTDTGMLLLTMSILQSITTDFYVHIVQPHKSGKIERSLESHFRLIEFYDAIHRTKFTWRKKTRAEKIQIENVNL